MANRTGYHMHRKGQRIFIAACIFAIVIFAICVGKPKEPRYGGHTLRYWLIKYQEANAYVGGGMFNEKGYANFHASQMALMAIGTNAIPALLKMFRAEDPNPRFRWWSVIRSKVDPGYMPAYLQHDLAYEGFQLLGPKGAPAAEALGELMKTGPDEKVRAAALSCLEQQNAWKILLPSLTEMFKHDPDLRLRRHAAGELVLLFPDDAEKAGVFTTYPEFRKYLPDK